MTGGLITRARMEPHPGNPNLTVQGTYWWTGALWSTDPLDAKRYRDVPAAERSAVVLQRIHQGDTLRAVPEGPEQARLAAQAGLA